MKTKELIRNIKGAFILGSILIGLFVALIIGVVIFFVSGEIILLSEKIFLKKRIIKC